MLLILVMLDCTAVVRADNLPPEFDCSTVHDTTLYLGVDKCEMSSPEVLRRMPILLAEDDEDGDVLGVLMGATSVTDFPSFFHAGSDSDVNWVFTDEAGNQTVCPFTLSVRDTIKPVIDNVIPKDITVKVDDGKNNALINITAPVLSESCGTITVSYVRSDNSLLTLSDAFSMGETYITWSFTDESANVSTCKQLIKVIDDETPVITCKSDLVKLVADAGQCSLSADKVMAAVSAPSAFDNGDGKSIPAVTSRYYRGVDGKGSAPVLSALGGVVSADDVTVPYSAGYTDVHFVFTDASGNSDSCVVPVYVSSVDAPVVDCNAFSAVRLPLEDATCALDLTADYLVTLNTVFASENCTEKKLSATPLFADGSAFSDTTLKGGKSIDILWQYTSSFGVSVTCPQSVFAIDTVKPLFDCTTLDTLFFNADNSICGAVVGKLSVPVAKDNCGDINGNASRSDGLTVSDAFPIGKSELSWTFSDSNPDNTLTCPQIIMVADTSVPVLTCGDFSQNITVYTSSNKCELAYSELNVNEPSTASDLSAVDCSPLSFSVVRVSDNDTVPLDNPYAIGQHFIYWVVADTFGNTAFCQSVVNVVDKEGPVFDCSKLDTVRAFADRFCEARGQVVVANGLYVPKSADDFCSPTGDSISAVAYRGDHVVFSIDKDAFPLGKTDITWQFTDAAGNNSTCQQTVVVSDSIAPVLDCSRYSRHIKLKTDTDKCFVSYSNLDIPVASSAEDFNAYDNCSSALTFASSRSSNGVNISSVSDNYAIGIHYLSWSVTDAFGNTSYCIDTIEVLDGRKPHLVCDELPDVILVASDVECSASPLKVQKAGLHSPTMVDTDCEGNSSTILGVGSRSDKLTLNDNYPEDTTVVTWLFQSTGSSAYCRQLVIVVDSTAPYVENCDALPDVTLYTLSERCSYTIDELLQHTVVPVATDNCSGSINGEPGYGLKGRDSIPAFFEPFGDVPYSITWTFRDSAGNTTYCSQHFYIRDTIPPVWVDGTPAVTDTMVSCSLDEIPEFPVSEFKATDNCSDVTYYYDRVSDRTNIYTDCSHYSYDLFYKCWAADASGNTSDTVYYTFRVRDTTPPQLHLPVGWANDSIYPLYLRNCYFAVPSVLSFMPDSALYDNCNANEYLHVWQVPSVNDTITQSQTIQFFAEDVCGNITSLQVPISVPAAIDITHLTAHDTVVCAGDELTLNSDLIRSASGNHYVLNGGQWTTEQSVIYYDCYRDSVSESSLVYSNNVKTNGKKFLYHGEVNEELMKQRNQLTRASKSGHYYYVAMDVLSECSDTADAYVTVIEKPRVSFDAGSVFQICEADSFKLSTATDNMDICTADMGSDITDEGWIINGVKYGMNEIVPKVSSDVDLIYYATNFCGTTFSDSSLFFSCQTNLSSEDSLKIAGSLSNYSLLQADNYWTKSLADIIVTHPYNPDNLILVTSPIDNARVWEGEDADLRLSTVYSPVLYKWYKVVGNFDAGNNQLFYTDGTPVSPSFDDELLKTADGSDPDARTLSLTALSDTSYYYVVASNGVCPAAASNLVRIDVIHQIPTAITPYQRDGMNDVFMKGHDVIIFNRYGQKVFEGSDGWDGTYRGLLADPGVYYYCLTLKNQTYKGSVEVVKLK